MNHTAVQWKNLGLYEVVSSAEILQIGLLSA